MLRQLYSEISSCRKCCSDEEIGQIVSRLDKFLFLPPRLEKGGRKYVFITMEPTDTWCNSKEHGEELLSDGMVNFYYSDNSQSLRGPFLLQFVAQTFLCDVGETYLITDLGKCSMPTEDNDNESSCPTIITRKNRYSNCLKFLKKELEIVSPKRIFIVGSRVKNFVWKRKFLKKHPWFSEYKAEYIYHYSGKNRKFNEYCDNNRLKFDEFKDKHKNMESEVRCFIERRKEEIKIDYIDKHSGKVYNILIECLNNNLKKDKLGKDKLGLMDWKMFFYYCSEFKKITDSKI